MPSVASQGPKHSATTRSMMGKVAAVTCKLVREADDNLLQDYKEELEAPEYADDSFKVVSIVAERVLASGEVQFLVKWEVCLASSGVLCFLEWSGCM